MNALRLHSSLKTIWKSSKPVRILAIAFLSLIICRALVPFTGCRFWETIWPHPEMIRFWDPRHDLFVNYCSKYDIFKTKDITSFTISANDLISMDLSGVSSTNNIPKILHQQHSSRSAFPQYLVPLVKECGQSNSDWIHVMWTDDDYPPFLKKFYPDLWPMFRDFAKDIQRWDTIRFFILYHFGGVYLDTDVQCLSTLDEWLLDFKDYEVLMEPVHMMTSPKQHPLWMDALQTIQKSKERIYGGHLIDRFGKKHGALVDRSEKKFREKHLSMLGVSAWKWHYHQEVGRMLLDYLIFLVLLVIGIYAIYRNYRKPIPSRREREEESAIFIS